MNKKVLEQQTTKTFSLLPSTSLPPGETNGSLHALRLDFSENLDSKKER